MRKFLSLILCIVVLVSVFTVNVSAVDNYEPKVINVLFDPVTEKAYIPEGYVVYVGDTLKLDRGTISFLGDFADSKNGGEIEYGAIAILSSYNIFDKDGGRLAEIWGGDELYINKDVYPKGVGWKEAWCDLSKPGTYTLAASKGRDTYWSAEYKLGNLEFLTFEVIDPATVDEIVLPPDPNADVPADEPVESAEPVESTESVESTEPVESIDEPNDDEPTDADPADNSWVIWVIIGAVVAAAVVVVIVLVSKKKK